MLLICSAIFFAMPSSDNCPSPKTAEVKPLPLFDAGAVLLGFANDRGNIVVKVSETYQTQPEWVGNVSTGSPAAWVGAWLNG